MPPSPHANRQASSGTSESKPPMPVAAPKKPEALSTTAGSATIPKKGNVASTATSSAAASPKPAKPKDTTQNLPVPPPLPGSGLGGPADGTESRAPTVVLSIPMNGEINKYVNFTRLAEEQYGWDALHPRLAAQRDRLARVAAAGAALERTGSSKDDSGDEMSLDSEGEGSNVEMGGMSDGRTGTDGGAKKVVRKRKMKEDEYDKDDGFVDDSELLWEEQAAAATDGFFVYSGPLVPEIEKPAAELRSVKTNNVQKHRSNSDTELMVHPSVAVVADEEAVVGDWEDRVLEVGLLLLRLAGKACQQPVLDHGEETYRGNPVSRKLIVQRWSWRSWRERRWEACPHSNQMGMAP